MMLFNLNQRILENFSLQISCLLTNLKNIWRVNTTTKAFIVKFLRR